MDSTPGGTTNLHWENIGLGFCFILFDAGLSHFFKLGVGSSLVTAAARCIIQLTLVSYILESVFKTNHPIAVAGIAGQLFCVCDVCAS
jgi:ABC-type iron transport system FetAB permease component